MLTLVTTDQPSNLGDLLESAEGLSHCVGLACIYSNDHANTRVECPTHFDGLNVSSLSEPLEYWQDLPRSVHDLGCESIRQHARNILNETAASNVCKTLDITQDW